MRLIDAERIAKDIKKYNSDNWNQLTWSSKMVHDFILNAQRIDAVEVVRCKDCKYRKKYKVPQDDSIWCTNRKALCESYENDFCSYGEKEESE